MPVEFKGALKIVLSESKSFLSCIVSLTVLETTKILLVLGETKQSLQVQETDKVA